MRTLWIAGLLLAASVLAEPVPVTVSGAGFEVGTLEDGAKAFANRDYIWEEVSPELKGWQFTRIDGGTRPLLYVEANGDGDIFLAAAVHQGFTGDLRGWELMKGWRFRYSADKRPWLRVFRRPAKNGERIPLPQGAWTGALVVAPRISVGKLEEQPHAAPPGIVINHRPAYTRNYVGCPAIAVLAPGRYVASHSFFGPGSARGRTYTFLSGDGGKTWQPKAEIVGLSFSGLFVHRDSLYLMGVYHGNVGILKSDDEGATWTEPAEAKSGLLLTQDKPYHSAPVPVVEHAGRIWRAMEDRQAGGKWPYHFRAFMMSAPADADLLDAASWTRSEPLASDPTWLDDELKGWLEGNAVVAPDGGIVNMLRVDSWEGGKAAMIRVSADGRTCSFDPATDLVDFPGGGKKFTIRRDPIGGQYWSLVNGIDETTRQGREAGAVRNSLVLVSSRDLRVWSIRRTVISHPDPVDHGFQYVDWQFDGDDIVAVSRTAFDDAFGGADNYHNANYFTFHRIEGFRKETTEP